jgi:hypothetical protein
MQGSKANPRSWREMARELFTWTWWKEILKDVLREMLFGPKPKKQYHAYWVWSQRWNSWEYRVTAEGFDLPLPPGRPEFPEQPA